MTYNDPAIFLEYAVDVADACRARGIRAVAVTAGYIGDEPRRELFEHVDAANVDLKAFTEDFYHRVSAGHLRPVLDTLVHLRRCTPTALGTHRRGLKSTPLGGQSGALGFSVLTCPPGGGAMLTRHFF